MSDKGVNLDALIQREDFAADGGAPAGNTDNTIGIHHLANNNFFTGSLRKPDFQRETTNWKPAAICDLIESFLDGKLIPAIILWQSGQYNFVIDGAHRLSAILAWVYDDYGDKRRSLNFFDNTIPEEQRKLAEQTRSLINQRIGPFSEFNDAMNSLFDVPAHLKQRIIGLSRNSFVAQWVRETDAEGAQNSFFKINQQGTPLDATERRILKARHSATAIATRAITRAGGGHRYWQRFSRKHAQAIADLGSELHDAMYSPPLGGMPIKTSDVPVCGKGYNQLPFIFDFVILANSVQIDDSTVKRDLNENLPKDEDGSLTIRYLELVRRKIRRITTSEPGSLGLHPLVYFYTRSGRFQPVAFLAVSQFIDWMIKEEKLNLFTYHRRRFEQFLMDHKEAYSLIVTKRGSGQRSRPALLDFFIKILTYLDEGKQDEQILAEIGREPLYYDLLHPRASRERGSTNPDFSSATKSATFISELKNSGVRCGVCEALVHRNSIQTDHIVPKNAGGSGGFFNAQISHPYCNSTFKQLADKPVRM